MELGLSGKAALVTGASRGIGRAVALELAREGASVFIVARGASDLARAAEEVAAGGAKVHSLPVDVSSEEGAAKGVEAAIEALGGLDILVNNVGGSGGAGRFDGVSAEQWRSVLDQNLLSAIWCSRRAVQHMRQRGGCIVHMNSICGREYCASAPYTAAKSALTALTKEMAIDLARYRIRVNSVAPGSILFPGGSWERRSRERPDAVQKMLREDLPWGRFGAPQEVAAVVTFLCSERASWVTGATIPVDGGQGRAF
ncbi:MAG: SDR family oxidoreductase [Myxococcales bacterium]|nr:SDR family oxidoreductase [Myxococcales bacterium]